MMRYGPVDDAIGSPHEHTKPARVSFLGLRFDSLDLDGTVEFLRDCDPTARFRYVVTPNVDHVVRLFDQRVPDRPSLWRAYRAAMLCVCDSRILLTLAQQRGLCLPVVPGSDLSVVILEQAVQPGDTVAIVGSTPEALMRLRARHPGVHFRHHIPPMGMRHNPAAMEAAADFVATSRARFTFLAVGSPQQELLAQRIAERGDAVGIGLCVGAAVDFHVGLEKRAPPVLRQLRMEWVHRLLQHPRRFWKRYLVHGPRIFLIFARWDPPPELVP